MTDSVKTRLAEIEAPYGRRIWLDDLAFASGMKMLRVTIREGSRFTIVEIDPATASNWADEMARWANARSGDNR